MKKTKYYKFKTAVIVVLLMSICVYLIIERSNNKFKTALIGSNLKEVREEWGEPYFQSISNGKIYEHYRPLFIYKCVFTYNKTDSVLIDKWKQID